MLLFGGYYLFNQMYKYFYLRKKLLKYHKSGRYVVVPYASRKSGGAIV